MKSREVINILTKAGFIEVSQNGSHCKLVKDEKTVIVPAHGTKDVKKGTLCAIWDQAGLKGVLKDVGSEREALKRLAASVQDAAALLPAQTATGKPGYTPNPDIPYPAQLSGSYGDWIRKTIV